ncbi:MAG TPA: CBS domain-containing protein [Candidatus Acidoferrales bacterium]|nr:CBS domain-containing protein [Candidatus Acidoferrales bacterium]
MIVRDVLKGKSATVWSVDPGMTVYATLELMAAKDIGAVLVVDEDGVVGVFSERDYARQVILKGKSSRDTQVRDVMTSRVLFVQPDDSLEECMQLMTGKRIRHLPVQEEGRLIGLISIGDVVKAVISEKEHIIQELENYIASAG